MSSHLHVQIWLNQKDHESDDAAIEGRNGPNADRLYLASRCWGRATSDFGAFTFTSPFFELELHDNIDIVGLFQPLIGLPWPQPEGPLFISDPMLNADGPMMPVNFVAALLFLQQPPDYLDPDMLELIECGG